MSRGHLRFWRIFLWSVAVQGSELKARLDRLGVTRREAAAALGLTLRGLYHQMSGERPVSRQTELLLEVLEERLHQRSRAA
jgi:hypothetical protein